MSNKLQLLESKEITIYTKGSNLLPNIVKFDVDARKALSTVNKVLINDEDFVVAKKDIELCSLLEIKISNAKQRAVQSMKEYFEQATIADKLKDEIRDTRLLLNKLIKTEEAKRKSEITQSGIDDVEFAVNSSLVKHGFVWDKKTIIDSIKGKRSIEKMEEAVEETVASLLIELGLMENKFATNASLIDDAEKEYPGLFPDWKTLALSPEEVVTANIENRITKFKYDQKIKEDAKRKKAEDERLTEEAAKVKAETILDIPPDPFSTADLSDDIPSPPTFDHVSQVEAFLVPRFESLSVGRICFVNTNQDDEVFAEVFSREIAERLYDELGVVLGK